MAHHGSSSAYEKLSRRINLSPQGAPSSELLHGILKMLFSEQEAALVSLLPIKPFNAKKAARCWEKSENEARIILEELAGRGILLDVEEDGESVYTLPPPMAGFFEFSMMRYRKDIDQKVLAGMFYRYMNVEEDFIKSLFTEGETQLGRVLVHEPALKAAVHYEVLDHERSSEIIRSAGHIGIGICYCRHKMEHASRACDAPLDICMTFNNTAESLNRHGITRKAEAAECLELLDRAYEHNLVQFGDNVRESVNFICNCCGCCCEAMLAAKRFAFLHPVHTTNFIPSIEAEKCSGCGKCVEACPVEAMSLVSAGDPGNGRRKKAALREDLCLGCGVCVRNCGRDALKLIPRKERVITPLNSAHRTVVMAIERGKLQNLIFDNQAMASHRAMASVLGVILKLPPVKQVMATRQMKSRYLEYLIAKMKL